MDQIAEMKRNEEKGIHYMDNGVNNKDFQGALLKIAVNYFQVSSVIIQLNTEWPGFVKS